MTINMSNDVNTNNAIMRTRFHQFTEQCDDETYKRQYEALMSLDTEYAFYPDLITRIASMKYDGNTFNEVCEKVYSYKLLIEQVDHFYDNHYDLINMNVFINSLLMKHMNDLTVSIISSLCKNDMIGLSILASYDDDSRNERTIGISDLVLKKFLNSNDNDEYILTVYSIYYSAMMYELDYDDLLEQACKHYCSHPDGLITYESFLRDIVAPGDDNAFNKDMMEALCKFTDLQKYKIADKIYHGLSCYEFCCFIRLISMLYLTVNVNSPDLDEDLDEFILNTVIDIRDIDDFDYPNEFLFEVLLTSAHNHDYLPC